MEDLKIMRELLAAAEDDVKFYEHRINVMKAVDMSVVEKLVKALTFAKSLRDKVKADVVRLTLKHRCN